MKKKRYITRFLCGFLTAVLVLTFCLPASAVANEPSYVRTVFNKTNGLPTDEANAVLQTKDDYLWVGSFGGLLRYDGTTFRNFSSEEAIPTPSIRALFEDSLGRLWIGSSDAGVFVYENDTFSAVPCTDKYGYLSIRDFAEDQNGKIYVASSTGVCEVRDGTMVPLSDPQIAGETVYSLGIDPYNRLWCALNAQTCAVLEEGRCIAVLGADLFFEGDRKIPCVASDNAHTLYLGTNTDVLARITFTGTATDGSDFSVRIFETKDASLHNRISVTADGEMLVSGEQGFAYLRSDGTVVDPHSQYRTDAVNWASIDREGNVWLASSNEGLVRYTPGYFATPNGEAGLTGKDINAVTMADGIFYVATDAGLLAFDSDWKPVKNPVTELLGSLHIKHLMTDSAGRLWCGTYSDFGVVRYTPSDGSLAIFRPQNGMDSTRVRVLYEMADGTVAVGTQDGLALIKDDEVTAFYDKDDGMDTQSILCLVQAPNGTLLAGSAGSGIYAVGQDGTIRKYSYEQGLGDGVVLRIVPEEGGKSGFVSAGSHLYYWSENTFRRLDPEIGVGSIFDLFERDGRLWLMQDSGIYSVDKAQLLAGESTHAIRYGTADGLTGSLNVNTWNYLSPDGKLYLSTRNGISIFDFRSMSHRIPRLTINRVTVDDAAYEHPSEVTLSKNNRAMVIDFAALTFSGTADLCIGYEMVGFSKSETVMYGTSGSVRYTNLPGGTYTFRLRTFDPESPENAEILEIRVIKEKRLTEQPWIWIVGALLAIAAIFALSHLMTHAKMSRLRKQRQMYRGILEQSLRTFANVIDAKDPYTNGHSLRVAAYAKEITRRMGYSEDDQETVYFIALLHDIGKVGIPDSILNKTGALTPEERAIIQTHPIKGGEILRDFTALKNIADGARYHHERYDGKGYCEGLAGEEIPLIGRIVCVADCYDAMSSDRCYRKALPKEKILEEFEKGSGTQFDPKIAAIMIDMIREGAVPITVSPDKKPAQADTTAQSGKEDDASAQ